MEVFIGRGFTGAPMLAPMAPNVQKSLGTATSGRWQLERMNRDFPISPAVLLFLLTAAAIVLAAINFQKESEFRVPSDGVWWVEHGGNLVADRVEANGPGAQAGIKEGDHLVGIDEEPVKNTAAQVRQMYRIGPWLKATYSVVRNGVPVDANVILVPAEKSLN